MDYFKTKTVDDLSKLHDMAFSNSSKATKVTFLQSIKRIEKLYNKPLQSLQLSFIDKPEDFLEIISNSKYSKNTTLTTITNILKLLKMIDAPLITYNKWLKILKEKTEERTKNDDDILKKKLKVLMNWRDIKDMVLTNITKYIDDDSNTNIDMDTFQNFLILALFTIQIPVRISNYVNMKVVEDDSYIDEKSNFLVINDNGYRFIFNKYRTSHIVGKKILFINETELQFLIDKWLSKYNRASNNFLIVSEKNKRPMNGKQIASALEESTEEIFGSPLNVDNLRASYMKHIAELDPDFQDKLDIANILGYSTTDVLDKHS
jgi:hypothetical protein